MFINRLIVVGMIALLTFALAGCPKKTPTEDRTKKEEPKAAAQLGYVGSQKCGETCHKSQYEGWDGTLHRKMVQDAKKAGVMLGDFNQKGNPFEVATQYKKEDIVYTIGSQWKQRYVVKRDKDYLILPAEWIVKTKLWKDYNKDKWDKRVWQNLCIACHTTGYDKGKRDINEAGIGCEACHGPGSEHVKTRAAKDIVNPAKLDYKKQTEVCGQCHIRGAEEEGKREDALGYKPGGDLLKFITPIPFDAERDKEDNKKAVYFPDKASRKHHQQYQDYIQSKHYLNGKVSCGDCHESHQALNAQGEIPLKKGSVEALCTSCHDGTRAPKLPTPIDINKYMPKRATSATEADIRSHTFKPDQPKAPQPKEPYKD